MRKSLKLFMIITAGAIHKTFAQCAMCKAVVENGDQDMAEGINNGIVHLMVFPYILVAMVSLALFFYFKKKKGNR